MYEVEHNVEYSKQKVRLKGSHSSRIRQQSVCKYVKSQLREVITLKFVRVPTLLAPVTYHIKTGLITMWCEALRTANTTRIILPL